MRNLLRVVAALVGCAVIVSAWVIYYYSVSTPPIRLQPFDPSEIARIAEQLRYLLGPVSAVIDSHFCAVTFDAIPARVYLNRAFNVSAAVSLPDKVDRCESNIAVLGAAAFSIEPKGAIKVSLDQQAPTRTVIFNLLPSKEKQVFVYGYDQTTRQAETTTYEYPFINPDLSLWFPILGTFFGGTLTLPWWLKLFGIPKPKDEQDKKEKTKKRKTEST
jgi:hypothetical protein